MKNTKKHIKHVNEALKGIEDIYISEKDKIEKSLKEFEKQRLLDQIDLVDRRRKEVVFVKNKLNELKKEVTDRQVHVKRDISSQKSRKRKEKSQFDTLYRLNEHLKTLEDQIKEIDTTRKIMLQKEKKLLTEISHFFKVNKKEIQSHGLKNARKINVILDKKTKIMTEASHALGEDIKTLFTDKKILEKVTDKQLDIVYRINNKLKGLRESHVKLLRERQSLKAEDYKFKQMLTKIKEEKKKLLLQLRNI